LGEQYGFDATLGIGAYDESGQGIEGGADCIGQKRGRNGGVLLVAIDGKWADSLVLPGLQGIVDSTLFERAVQGKYCLNIVVMTTKQAANPRWFGIQCLPQKLLYGMASDGKAVFWECCLIHVRTMVTNVTWVNVHGETEVQHCGTKGIKKVIG